MPGRLRGATFALLALLVAAPEIEADPPPAPPTHAAVEGHVRQEDGTPVAGVEVRLVVRRRWASRNQLECISTADGRYRFDAAPAGDALVYVVDQGLVSRGLADVLADDAGPSARTLRAAETASIDVIVTPGATLKGRVVRAAGSPAGTLRVEAVPSRFERPNPAFVPPSATSEAAADGTFALVGLVPGLAYDVRVLSPGAPPVERARVVAGVAQDALTLALPAHREVALTVLGRDEIDQPLAGAAVRLRHADASVARGSGAEVRTDAAGQARVFVPEGAKALVAVEAAGWIASSPEPLPPGDRSTIRLVRPRRIHGKVLHPDGRPAAGVVVVVAFEGDNAPHTVTEDDGCFVLEGLSPEPLVLGAGSSADGEHGLRAVRHVVPDGTEVVLRLEPFGDPKAPRLRVRLFDPEGRIVPRARVALRTLQDMTMYGAAGAGEATFVLGEDDAEQRLAGASVVAWGAESEEGRPLPLGPAVVGPVAEGQTEVDVRLPPERVREGRVLGPGAEPVVGARVYVRAAVRERDPLELATEDHSVRTDAEGRFTARGLPDADLVLHVDVPRPYVRPAAVSVPRGTAPIVVEVASGASVAVTVVDPDGKPVAGAEVRAWFPAPAKGPEVVAKTDAHGVARLAGLDPARRPVLRVDGPSPFPRWEQADWTPAPTTVRLGAGGGLGGTVRGSNGAPLARVFVQHDDPSTERWNRSQLTGRDGRFAFDHLRAGALTLTAVLDDCLTENEAGPDPVTRRVLRVEVGARDLDIRLDPGRTLDVLPPHGTPSDTNLELRCLRGDRLFRRLRTTTRGEPVRVNGLAANDRVFVYVPADADGRAALRVAGPGQSSVRLERTIDGTLRGRVVLPPGAARAHVHASEETLAIGLDAHTDAEGRYEIRGVPEAWTWTVSADVRIDGVGWVGEVAHVRRGEVPDLALTKSP